VKYLLLVLFVEYYGSNTLFNHTHTVNGAIITHSHPFNPFKGKSPNHHHTPNEFLLITFLFHALHTILFSAFFLLVAKTFTEIVLCKRRKIFINHAFLYSNGLRAPPVR
jgi:hypothetical protein